MCEPTHPHQGFCEIWENERWNSGQKRRFSGWFAFFHGAITFFNRHGRIRVAIPNCNADTYHQTFSRLHACTVIKQCHLHNGKRSRRRCARPSWQWAKQSSLNWRELLSPAPGSKLLIITSAPSSRHIVCTFLSSYATTTTQSLGIKV